MKKRILSLLLAVAAISISSVPAFAATDGNATKDSTDIALEKSLAELRNSDIDATTDEEVVFDSNGDTLSSTAIKDDVLDSLNNINNDDSGAIVAVITILGIFFMPFIAIIGIVWVICSYRSSERRQRYILVSKAIDHNYALPPNVFERNMRSPIRSSAYLLALGLGVIIFFLCMGEWKIGLALGCVPILIGAAKLTAYRLEKEDRQ